MLILEKIEGSTLRCDFLTTHMVEQQKVLSGEDKKNLDQRLASIFKNHDVDLSERSYIDFMLSQTEQLANQVAENPFVRPRLGTVIMFVFEDLKFSYEERFQFIDLWKKRFGDNRELFLDEVIESLKKEQADQVDD